jgi:hypothetical protein
MLSYTYIYLSIISLFSLSTQTPTPYIQSSTSYQPITTIPEREPSEATGPAAATVKVRLLRQYFNLVHQQLNKTTGALI